MSACLLGQPPIVFDVKAVAFPKSQPDMNADLNSVRLAALQAYNSTLYDVQDLWLWP